jgi:8-oxo-dGTP pyrophosphatase MutT (NUDIX family)
MRNRKDWVAAEIEALEEAGLKGKMVRKPIGSFLYWKRLVDRLELIRVEVYRMDVTSQLPTWKEASERQVGWFSLPTAAELVEETGLMALLAGLTGENA